MISEPLFEQNIADQLFKNFDHYLFFENWIFWYVGALFLVYLCYKILSHKNVASYPCFISNKVYPISWTHKPTRYAFLFLCLCFGVYALSLYLNETSFFNNYDTMSINTMQIIEHGVTPMWCSNGRFSPLAFWDVNFVYAITHNFKVINIYILLQTLVVLYLLNVFFDFMPADRRFLTIGLFMLSPVFFWNNAVSYPEKLLLIYVLSSLICFKKYTQNTFQTAPLFFGVLWMNFAIYTKESTILLYLGILACSCLYNIFIEKIRLSSFIHPLRTARQFPLETLIFISLLIFSQFYLINVGAVADSVYLTLRESSVFGALKVYIFEVAVVFAAVLLAVQNFCKKNLNLFEASLLCGAVFIIIAIVFYLQMVPFSSQLTGKTYYLVLPYMVGLFYLATHIPRKWAYAAFSSVVCCWVLFSNIKIAENEEGHSYRTVAEFLVDQKQEPLNIFLSEHTEPLSWWYSCWSTVYKYYFPYKKIFFKISSVQKNDKARIPVERRWNAQPKLYHRFLWQDKPIKRDFYVIKKTEKYQEDRDILREISNKKVFENKFFEVYEIL